MKKILLLILSMAMLVCAVPHMAFAANTTINVNGLTYELTLDGVQKTAVLKDGSGADNSVKIPDKVNYNGSNYNVTSIGESAFSGCRWLESVVIPDSVTSIGAFAFFDCSSLNSVMIGSGVVTIGAFAFSNCRGLVSVMIGNSVTTIGDFAFLNCSNLASVMFTERVTTIGDWAFGDCSVLDSLQVPINVTNIGNLAFCNCVNLKLVLIPKNFDRHKFKNSGIDISNDENTFTVYNAASNTVSKGEFLVPYCWK